MPFSESVQRKIAEDNLNMQELSYQDIEEARLSHIKDLVDLQLGYLKDKITKDALLDSYQKLDFFSHHKYDIKKDAMEGHKSHLLSTLSQLQIQDKVSYAKLLSRELQNRGFTYENLDVIGKPKDTFSVCYYKNPYTDVIIDFLLEFSPNFKITYEEDYSAACISVLSGNADYTILPMKFENGKYIATSMELITSGNLTIFEMMPVYDSQNNLTTYALVGKAPLRIPTEPRFLLRFSNDTIRFQEIITGITLLLGDVKYASYSKEETSELLLEFDATNTLDILVYLLLFYKDFKILGCYQPDNE